VAVVDVGAVPVRVHDRRMLVPVRVRFARIDARRMLVLVVLLVRMPVLVRECFVRVVVRVALREHAAGAERHQ
jgi:hypothetical protein